MQDLNNSRRIFLKRTTLGGLATLIVPNLAFNPFPAITAEKRKLENLTFLFQGDSITDGNRGRNNDPNHIMGHGYAFSIASRVGARFPEKKLIFYNRGISGNTVTDLGARWQKDTLEIKPDVLSILVGVNDTDQAVKQKNTEGSGKYEEGYRSLLSQTKAEFPDCLLILMEPFIQPVGRVKENWPQWQKEMEQKQAVVKRLAKEFQTVFVPLQEVFNQAAARVTADYWVWDGIHPTVPGHDLITQAWLKQVGQQLPFLKKLT